MIIETLTSKDEKLWDEYGSEHPLTTFYHQINWKSLIEATYARYFTPLYLIAKNKGVLKGILPVYFYKHPLFGKKLISLAFASHGGPCADDDDVANQLIQEAVRLTKNLNAGFYELRDSIQHPGEFNIIQEYCTQHLMLRDDIDTIFSRLSTNIRRNLKKSFSLDIRTEFNSSEFDTFYRIYTTGLHNLGTPIHKETWIKNIFKLFPDQHELVISYYRNEPVSVQMIRKFRRTITGIFGYALPEFRYVYANHCLHWELIKYAHDNEYQIYDFGRSRIGGGVYEFKRKWGARDIPLYNHFYMHRSKTSVDTGQANPARGKFAKLWRKLPLPLANSLGPLIRKNYP